MNYRLVVNQLGLLLLVLSTLMLAMAAIFFAFGVLMRYREDPQAQIALLLAGGIGLTLGFGLWVFTRGGSPTIGRREAILLVGTTWLLGAAIAAMPYLFWAHLSDFVSEEHPFRNVADCYFEAMSGLTTTGASILSDIEAVPRSLLLWRALTQWLGGLGIVVLFVAVLPALGASARRMFSAEASGVTKKGIAPQIRETARLLWYIYLSFTVIQIGLLRAAGMDWFDSVCHTFCSIATGGFSTRNASIAAYDSALIEFIIFIFMLLGAVNFALYYQAIRGRFREIYNDRELRLFLALLFLVIAVCAALIYGDPILLMNGESAEGTLVNSVRYSAFSVVSLMTTTGFTTAEYDTWHPVAKSLIYFLVFIGGCASSTSGGTKVIRFWIVLKTLYLQIERAFRPSVVRPIRIGQSTIGEDVCLATLAFIAAYIAVLVCCTIALAALESHNDIDMATAVSGALACISTTGPGVARLGGTENYGWMTSGSKWLLSFAMVVGRLEVFTILVLFAPRFWRNR